MNSQFDPIAEIGAALRRQTSERRDFLIVTSDAVRNYYVQFPHPGQRSPESIYCEAVADEWLKPEHQLGEAGAAHMRALGWSEPTRRSRNWSRKFQLRDDSDFATIAATLVETLSAVYGYEGGPLEVRVAD